MLLCSLLCILSSNNYYDNSIINSCSVLYVALPIITLQPTSIVLKSGYESTALWCLANGTGPIHYQWEKYQSSNDSWIIPAYRVVNSTSSTLKFNKVSEEDEGIYHCVVTNDDGSVTSDNATITVYGMYIHMY